MPDANSRFASDVIKCITDASEIIASTDFFGDHCQSPAERDALQAERLRSTLGRMRGSHGYAATLWCAYYATPFPSWPFGDEWYRNLLCPWGGRMKHCQLGQTATFDKDEIHGEAAPGNGEQRKYREQLLTMSCGLCQHLHDKLGPPPFTGGRPVANTDAGGRPWVNQWVRPRHRHCPVLRHATHLPPTLHQLRTKLASRPPPRASPSASRAAAFAGPARVWRVAGGRCEAVGWLGRTARH